MENDLFRLIFEHKLLSALIDLAFCFGAGYLGSALYLDLRDWKQDCAAKAKRIASARARSKVEAWEQARSGQTSLPLEP